MGALLGIGLDLKHLFHPRCFRDSVSAAEHRSRPARGTRVRACFWFDIARGKAAGGTWRSWQAPRAGRR